VRVEKPFSDPVVLLELSVLSPAARELLEKQPERRLLWAILQDGLETYMKYATATTHRGRRLFQEAEEWIMQDDSPWPCSFETICQTLDLNPGYLRRGLHRWRAKRVARTAKKAA
jgi:hypothetical protein